MVAGEAVACPKAAILERLKPTQQAKTKRHLASVFISVFMLREFRRVEEGRLSTTYETPFLGTNLSSGSGLTLRHANNFTRAGAPPTDPTPGRLSYSP